MTDELDADPTRPEPAPETPFVDWPDPSPLQSWWLDIMDGGSPATRSGHD
ncbi:hypothetical protein [Nocardia rhizosphaerae]|uniref:Uncharacterized protein n=1 Tax=Nocardia rhizosphaerae TaxID=1691571 RepID=A0ABV8LBF1_9NOCA